MAWMTVASLLLASQPGVADTYTVLNTHDSGAGSLRSAIVQANTHTGPDTIIFAPAMTGRAIPLRSVLPSITAPRTTINGDINGDGAPDVVLEGTGLAVGDGLLITADQCVVKGLAVIGFPQSGITLRVADSCTVCSCYFGVNLSGRLAAANRIVDLLLAGSDQNTIGGTTLSRRNVFAAANEGVYLGSSYRNLVVGNYFGVRPDGSAALGTGLLGVVVGMGSVPAIENTIGGTSSGAPNLFGGLTTGIDVGDHAYATGIQGNSFGLAADGNTVLPLSRGVCLESASGTLIGGAIAGAGNVFAGVDGVLIEEGGANNQIQGNLFGSNAAGTARRNLTYGVRVLAPAGAQTIGGATAAAANYFTPDSPSGGTGVYLDYAGHGSLIRGNRFGIQHDGVAVPLNWAVIIDGASATLTENRFAKCDFGVLCSAAGGRANVFGNTFQCGYAVTAVGAAHCELGNLGNPATTDDGGNVFNASNTWDIWNDTPNSIKAEGNHWGTTSRAAIEAKIWDGRDAAGLGWVDYIPLAGGVMPTGAMGGVAALAVTGAAAVPTATGAEITFTLSAPAQVTVEILNLAGRPVALAARARASNAGLQRLVWHGASLTGAAAPAGRYLARITAQDATGSQASALVSVSLGP